MKKQHIKQCSVVLGPDEVHCTSSRVPDQDFDPVYSVWMTPEEAALVYSILTVVKQEHQDECTSDHFVSTEHVKLEFKEEMEDIPSEQLNVMEQMNEMEVSVPSMGNTELLTQTEVGIPSHQIKLEPMEDTQQVNSMEFVEVKEVGISSHQIKLECMEDIPSQCDFVEKTEDYIPTHQIKSECMEDIPSQCEFVEGTDIKSESMDISSPQLDDTKSLVTTDYKIQHRRLTEGRTKIATTEFVDIAKVKNDMLRTHSVIVPNSTQSIPPIHITPDVVVQVIKKSFFKESRDHLSDEILNSGDIHVKPEQSSVYLCSLCHQFKDEILSLEMNQLNRHLDSHIDTTFKKCVNCSTNCININDYYFHVKCCNSRTNSVRDINFTDYITPQDCHTDYWWKVKCKFDHCNARMPNLCSKVIHEMYCSSRVRNNYKFFILSDSLDYQCAVCKASFKNQALFQSHCTLPIIFAESLTRCNQCDIGIESEQDYMLHIKAGGHTLNCQICHKKFKAVNAYISHKSYDHNVRMIHCSGCCKSVNIMIFNTSHLNTCFFNDVRPFVCTLCGRKCERFEELMVHMNREVLRLKYEYQCRKCHNYFCSKFNLCCHMVNSQCGSSEFNVDSLVPASLTVVSIEEKT